jgi:hypothetical protein
MDSNGCNTGLFIFKQGKYLKIRHFASKNSDIFIIIQKHPTFCYIFSTNLYQKIIQKQVILHIEFITKHNYEKTNSNFSRNGLYDGRDGR